MEAGRALGGSEEDGGLGWARFGEQEEKPVVGIMSENCLVRNSRSILNFNTILKL